MEANRVTILLGFRNVIRGSSSILRYTSSLNIYIIIIQAFGSLLETGRLEKKDTDVEPYIVDGKTYLAELSHGIRNWYLWGPSYGDQAQPEIKELLS